MPQDRKGRGQAKVGAGITAARIRIRKKQNEGKPLSAAERLIINPKATGEQQQNAMDALAGATKKRKGGLFKRIRTFAKRAREGRLNE